MALNLFSSVASSLLDQASFVATNDLSSQVIWPQLRSIDVEITSEASQTEQPLSSVQYNDDGTYTNLTAADVATIKIIRPSAVRVTAICSDLSAIENVINGFDDMNMTISISTKSIIIPDLCICTIGIEQSGNMLSAAQITIELEQVASPTPSTYWPQQSGDVPSYGITVQTLKTTNYSLTSLVSKVAQKITPPTVSSVTDALLGSHGEPFLLGMGGSKLS
jgi:hypothetical protein